MVSKHQKSEQKLTDGDGDRDTDMTKSEHPHSASVAFPFTVRFRTSVFGSVAHHATGTTTSSDVSSSAAADAAEEELAHFRRRRHESQRREQSALDVVSKLTLDEKLRLISGTSLWTFGGIERPDGGVCIPEVVLADGPHGVRKPTSLGTQQSHPATCFPTACSLSCGWDPHLSTDIGRALSEECESFGVSLLLGPGMNLKRHPCGGRNFEYLSEDPLLTGHLASALIRGIQESGTVGACAKHVMANNQETHRFVVNSVCDLRTLRELYGAGFEHCIKTAQPWALMCAYNRLNGVYCSENANVFRRWVRDELGFGVTDADHDGALTPHIVMTDWGACNDRVEGIAAGVDLEMPGSGGAHDRAIRQAIDDGRLTDFQLDACCGRIVQFIHRATRYHGLKSNDDEEAPCVSPSEESSTWKDAHHLLALRAARETIVLLKNEDSVLPLAEGEGGVAIVGQFAKHPRYQGSGSSQVNPTKLETVYDLIGDYADTFEYAKGYHLDEEGIEEADIDKEMLSRAVEVAKRCKVCLCFVGIPEIAESEGFDRPHIQLPSQHNALIREVTKVNPSAVVILSNGGPVEMPWIDSVPAVIETYLAGQAGSRAVLDIVYGRVNPCGKLAETFPIKLEDVLADKYFPGDRDKVEYREGLAIGYRYFDLAKKSVLFPFGHGLSYTVFQFTALEIKEVAKSTVKIELTITNTGQMAGSEVIQCYVSAIKSRVFRPDQELKAFEKVHLDPGESRQVSLALAPHCFTYYDIGVGKWLVEDGDYEIRLGTSSRDIRARETITLQTDVQPSAEAVNAYPPPTETDLGQDLSDDAFMKRIAVSWRDNLNSDGTGALLKADDADRIHRNSLLSECQKTFFGKLLRSILVKNMVQHIEEGATKEKQMKVVEAFADNFPLRGLVLFSDGSFSFYVLDWMIACMNGHYLTGFRMLFPIIFCCRFRS